MGVILYILSLLLVYVLSLPLILYSLIRVSSFKEAGDYFFDLAISIDQFGNAIGKYLFNDIMITKDGHKYGDIDETISSVTGRNCQNGTLTKTGILFKNILDRSFGKDHCINSIEKNNTNE